MVRTPSPTLARGTLKSYFIESLLINIHTILTFSDYSMEPHYIVVGDLTHDAHFVLKLVSDSLGGVLLDDLHRNSECIHLSLVHISKLPCSMGFVLKWGKVLLSVLPSPIFVALESDDGDMESASF